MDPQTFLESVGLIGIFLAVFIESGVPLGIVLPLPGFSLLFTAGVFATTGRLELELVLITGIIAASLGYIVGYFVGKKYGRKLFYELETKKYFTAAQGEKAEKFMSRFGYSTLIIGRYLFMINNLAPILAGIANMRFVYFMIANVAGATIWASVAVFSGFYMGQNLPNAEYYIIPVVVAGLVFANSKYGKRILAKVSEKIESV